MKPIDYVLIVALALVVLVGCGQVQEIQVETVPSSGESSETPSSLRGIEPVARLALGTLQLDGTANAVTEAQAAALLPLWQVLQGGELQGEAEQYAVLRQIEATMTEAQVSAIAGLRLTTQEAQDWIDTQGVAASGAGGQGPGSGQMPTGMSEEQLAKMRAQFSEQLQGMSDQEGPDIGAQSSGTIPFGRGQSQALTRAVIDLLTERSGIAEEPTTMQAVVQVVKQAADRESTSVPEGSESSAAAGAPESPAAAKSSTEMGSSAAAENATAVEDTTAAESPAAEPDGAQGAESSTPERAEPVVYVVQAGNSLAAIAAAYGVTVEVIVEANGIEDPNTIYAGQELIIVEPGRIPEPAALAPSALAANVQARSEPEAVVAVPAVQALEWLLDNDPGPPFTIEVSANRATQDPIVEQSQTYLVTGIVRNDGDRTYAVSSLGVTFYDAEGFRGTFDPAIRDGKLVGGEWNWHGQTEAEFAALLLAPGEEWPFSVEITAQDMASFAIHPDAAPTGRETAPVKLSDVCVVDEGTGYVRISGTATNVNPFKVKNVTVSGVLLDGSGQIVSLGSVYVLQEDVDPAESVPFDVRVAKEPYVRYQLYAQAERDWQ